MKYYDEQKMVEIRKTLEKEVLKWKGVTSRPMMGCLCYFYNRKFIGFLVTNGIVLMKTREEDQKEIKEKIWRETVRDGRTDWAALGDTSKEAKRCKIRNALC